MYDKLRHHESSLYGTQMPFAMLLSGGQAVHYSFDRVRVGDKVIVYRS